MHMYAAPTFPNQIYTQAYFAVIAAVLYFVLAGILNDKFAGLPAGTLSAEFRPHR